MKSKIVKAKGETEFVCFCQGQANNINSLLTMIEFEFNTKMSDHQDIRRKILDISNYIKRLPEIILEEGE